MPGSRLIVLVVVSIYARFPRADTGEEFQAGFVPLEVVLPLVASIFIRDKLEATHTGASSSLYRALSVSTRFQGMVCVEPFCWPGVEARPCHPRTFISSWLGMQRCLGCGKMAFGSQRWDEPFQFRGKCLVIVIKPQSYCLKMTFLSRHGLL